MRQHVSTFREAWLWIFPRILELAENSPDEARRTLPTGGGAPNGPNVFHTFAEAPELGPIEGRQCNKPCAGGAKAGPDCGQCAAFITSGCPEDAPLAKSAGPSQTSNAVSTRCCWCKETGPCATRASCRRVPPPCALDAPRPERSDLGRATEKRKKLVWAQSSRQEQPA